MRARIVALIGETVPRKPEVDPLAAVAAGTASAAAAASETTKRISRDGRIRTAGLLLPKQAR